MTSGRIMKRIAVLTSGGDAPGMNAAIRAVVRSAIQDGHTIMGVKSGFLGLMEGNMITMDSSSVGNILQRGGTILKTSRCEEFKSPQGIERAKIQLEKNQVDGMIIIGGDGSFRGALDLSRAWDGQVIGIPGTIDNDLFGTDETIGFDTAINTALNAVDKIRDTADAHGRFFLVEVMGKFSGFIALQVGIACGAEEVLIPELDINIDSMCHRLCEYRKVGKDSSIIVVAEGSHLGNAHELADLLEKKCGNTYHVVVLGHLQRGGAPTAKDRILASELGNYAIRTFNEGKTGVMVGSINKKLSSILLKDTITNKKKLDEIAYELLEKLV